MAAYLRVTDADRFLLGVSMTRLLAARETGVAPEAVAIDRRCESCGQPHGRVRLPDAGLHVSVAHSGDFVGIAASPDGRVGLDIEVGGHWPDLLDLARHALTAPEIADLGELDESRRTAGFLRYWVRKEAVLKLSGDGIADLLAVTVSAPDQAPAVRDWPARPELVGRVGMQDIDLGVNHVAAVAVDGVPTPKLIEADAAELLAAAG